MQLSKAESRLCPFKGCYTILNRTFGQIDYTAEYGYGLRHCIWTIQNAGIREAVALISVEEIDLSNCREYFREYAKITDGNSIDIFKLII
ncbi:hypothetical protein ACROYT_G040900 [Oculina patagonica]